jgi:hypothetical protein
MMVGLLVTESFIPQLEAKYESASLSMGYFEHGGNRWEELASHRAQWQ